MGLFVVRRSQPFFRSGSPNLEDLGRRYGGARRLGVPAPIGGVGDEELPNLGALRESIKDAVAES